MVGGNAKKTFTGEELLAWLSVQMSIPLTSATIVAEKLFLRKYLITIPESPLESFDKDKIYQFFQDHVGGLNAKIKFDGETREAKEVVEEMRTLLEEIEIKFIKNNGRAVNYQAITTSPQFKNYQVFSFKFL